MGGTADHGDGNGGSGLWRGVDLSGVTLVLGVGTGTLVQVLAEQIAHALGQLIVLDYQWDRLVGVAAGAGQALYRLRARPREIPILRETVDLLVVSGVLREVPETKLTPFFEELWRVLVPGGRMRVSDVLEPSEAEYDQAWRQRNRIIRRLGRALGMPTALAVDLKAAAGAIRTAGFDDPQVSLLPGVPLTYAWLEETVVAVRNMTSRVADPAEAHAILDTDLPALIAAYRQGQQRAAERFVLSARKVGGLALDMEASFTEKDLLTDD